MWADVETSIDLLNFRTMAGLASNVILEAQGKPLSIGVSGGWGVGKSSMVKLIEEELKKAGNEKVVYLSFNAWLYQGHDDAKAAFMEEISRKLMDRAKDDKTLFAKAVELFNRVRWFRALRLGTEAVVTLKTGIPVSALTGHAEDFFGRLMSGDVSPTELAEDAKKLGEFAKAHKDEAKGLLNPAKAPETPPQMIHAFRSHFEKLLKELDVTLVVFVDDLDRCLPPTVIGTLEAMRLFLFMERTAFVIAADEKMIKEAVRIHFTGTKLDDDLVVSYFDKLIQVPLRVPPLGMNEARAYLMLLFVENSTLAPHVKDDVRTAVNKCLRESWKGESVTAAFVNTLIPQCPPTLKAEFAVADRLAKQMVTSRRISGNPRLIKRFLNTLSIRRKLAKIYEIDVDDAILAKILLFERCADRRSFEFLVEMVNQAVDGKPAKIRSLETAAKDGSDLALDAFPTWKSDQAFVSEWLALDPPLADQDLRGALHVGRESMPFSADDDHISKMAKDVTNEIIALKVNPTVDLKSRFERLNPDERVFAMGKLLERAAIETSWGTPTILLGLMFAADTHPALGQRLVEFFCKVPADAFSPAFVVRIGSHGWAGELIEELLQRDDLPEPVKKVLKTKAKGAR
jgi:predicted KAP-like P-loop ATPase